MKRIKKAKKAKKVKTKKLVFAVPKRKRGRPRKNEVVETPKRKRGRPRKTEAVVAPKKRGRPKKVKETKEEKLRKVAKLGKRKYKAAVEQMAMEKINRKMRRKNGFSNGNSCVGEAVSSRVYSYERYSPTVASATQPPTGIKKTDKVVKDEMPVLPIEDRIKKRLKERGYDWKASSFKVVEKNDTTWVVQFTDKKQGEITSFNSVTQAKHDAVVEKRLNGKAEKMPKLSKVELNRYVKKLEARGLHPTNIKVLENTPEYFRIEFNDGDNGSVVTCGHVKGWDV